MNFSFLNNWPIFRLQSNTESENETKLVIVKSASPNFVFWNVKYWGRSFQSLISWAVSLKTSVWSRAPMSSEMPQYPRSYVGGEPGCPLPRFRPYVAKVPWHRGARGFLSQLFPRYGHYCGPNWSSGKDNGLPLWDKRPIDWLDFCCYCHDIGYDTHDQERLLKADLAFLECLERPRTRDTKGDPRIALLYQSMCITGTFAGCEPLMRLANDVVADCVSYLSLATCSRKAFRLVENICGVLLYTFINACQKA